MQNVALVRRPFFIGVLLRSYFTANCLVFDLIFVSKIIVKINSTNQLFCLLIDFKKVHFFKVTPKQ